MLCYKDQTWCSFHENCQDAGKCGRALTDDVRDRAKATGLGICQWSARPTCFVQIKTPSKFTIDVCMEEERQQREENNDV